MAYLTSLNLESLRVTSHTRLRACDHCTSSTLIGGKGRAGPSSLLHITLEDQQSMWMQDGCKVYMDYCMAANGSRFMVTWAIFKNHLLEVARPITKPGDHGTLNAHNRWFILFYHAWGPAWIEIHWNSIWLRAGHIWLHTALEGPWPHYMILGVCWDGLWTLLFWALTISRSRLLARVWNGPITMSKSS